MGHRTNTTCIKPHYNFLLIIFTLILIFTSRTTEAGSCIDAGYDMCCTDGFCAGVPEEAACYCDSVCLIFGDCCDDFEDICPGQDIHSHLITQHNN